MTEREIFVAALDQPDAEQRRAFLDHACADNAEVRARIEALLAANEGLGSFLERPVDPLATGPEEPASPPIAEEQAGSRVGPYKLLEQIGEGGMGTVWMADQTAPIRRRVAVKVVKAGMDSRQVLARFEAERQALALMDHPNIAKVLDAGSTASGRPYFVMELVKGVPLTKFCDDRQLGVQERLRIFQQVCSAVQHAHQKGVIHRDLKPSNVLVESHDGRAVPKVIDFGLAKATGTSLTDRTLFTNFGAMVGTPLYMAPEQAEFGALDIDTRADVYALGVLLYELLTGTTPIERGRLERAAWDEIRRVIKEEEPPSPSARLSSSETRVSVAALRQTEPAKLGRFVRGDLDWVVMKALAKERDRRYESASAFAADVERFLNHEPVSAGPPTASYRFRRFLRRNRPQVIFGAVLLTALAAGMVGTTIGLIRANAARKDAEAAQLAEAEQKRAAVAKEAEANAVVKFFEDKVFAAARPKGHRGGLSAEVSLREAITASLPALAEGFVDQPLVEARLRRTLADTLHLLGDPRMVEQYERARALFTEYLGPDHPVTLKSVADLAICYANRGRRPEAIRLHEEALAGRRRVLPADHPDIFSSMTLLASDLTDLGRAAEAIKLLEPALAGRRRVLPPDHLDTFSTMGVLANAHQSLGRHADALGLRQEVLAGLRQVLPPDHPELLDAVSVLANSYAALHRHKDALQLREEVLAGRRRVQPPDHPSMLWSKHDLADSYKEIGRHAEALALNKETLAAREANLGPNHPDALWSLVRIAQNLADLKRDAEAVLVVDDLVRRAGGRDINPIILLAGLDCRVRAFVRLNDPAGCRDTARMWEKLNRTDPDSLYKAVGFWAITSGVQAKAAGADAARLAREDGDRAMAWLAKGMAARPMNRAALERALNHDYAPLRNRADYQALIASLPAAKP